MFLSQDPVGIAEWNDVVLHPDKNDIHTANQQAFNLPSRLIAKVFLFRWIYRGSAFAYSKDPDFTPVSKSVDFWQNVIDKYYSKYKEIERTHMRFIKEATTNKKIISPFGREYTFYPTKNFRGELKFSENDITNWPNQGCGADVMAVARIAAFQRAKRLGLKGLFISTVHDSIVADVPQEEVAIWCELFSNVFKDLPALISKAFDVNWNVPMVGEISVGPNMKELVEVK